MTSYLYLKSGLGADKGQIDANRMYGLKGGKCCSGCSKRPRRFLFCIEVDEKSGDLRPGVWRVIMEGGAGAGDDGEVGGGVADVRINEENKKSFERERSEG